MDATIDSSRPTVGLTDEHGPVLTVVGTMEREASSIRYGTPIHGDDVAKMMEFTREFIDGYHHVKEEKVLFPRMLAASPWTASPVSAMLQDHVEGRTYVGTIVAALPAACAGDRESSLRIADALESYSESLRRHISEEDERVFPLVERLFDADAKRELAEEFARIDREEAGAGVYDKYYAMAEELQLAA